MTTCWFNIRLNQPNSAVGGNSPNFQFNSTEGNRKTFSLASATSPTSSSPASTHSGVSTNPTISSTSGATPATPTTPSTSQDSSASANHPGLSTGAQAGIGVGVGVAGIATGAAAVALVYRRRKKRGGSGPGENAFSGSSQYRPTTTPPPNTISSSSPYQKPEYYAQFPNNYTHEAQFQDSSKLGQNFVAYDGWVGSEAQKFRGAPIGSRHEMDGTSSIHVHEMG